MANARLNLKYIVFLQKNLYKLFCGPQGTYRILNFIKLVKSFSRCLEKNYWNKVMFVTRYTMYYQKTNQLFILLK